MVPRGFDEEMSTKAAEIDGLRSVQLTGAELIVCGGPEAGLTVPIGPGGLVIGTGDRCDVRLTDELVSRTHLELKAESHGVRAVDRGSMNGTFVGPTRIRDVILVESTVLQVGTTPLKIALVATPLTIELSARSQFGDAIAHSPAMRHVFTLLERAARTDVTVLLEGDSGTGKEVLARAIHDESARKEGPFVVVDCGAISESLVESELFGHEKGAFTGAISRRPGAFEQANGGTIFLDEIGELPLDMQPKLLRALENRAFRRVGGSETVNVDVRVVAATNRRLRDAVRRREFREDLFYRLAVVHIAVPRLAERLGDVVPLAERFLRMATRTPDATLPPDLARLLVSYDWPGNVRELRNVIERFSTFEQADPQLLFGGAPAEASRGLDLSSFAHLPYHEAKKRLMDAFHRAVLPLAVERAGDSVPRAAEQLGLPKASLYRMLQDLGDAEPESP
jgi:transcriptional regulator with PAS, ATPase and Fis domain